MTHQVIYHVDNTEKWPVAIGNAVHMMEYYDQAREPYTIEILANGDAVGRLVSSDQTLAKSLQILHQKGVILSACHNALAARKLTANDLYAFVREVPAGVVQLTLRQEQGWAYIRP